MLSLTRSFADSLSLYHEKLEIHPMLQDEMIPLAPIAWQIGTLAAGVVLAPLVLALGHWFPWVRRLPRLRAYAYGTASIWIGFALWRALNGDWLSPAGLAVVALVGGAAVHLAYYVDSVIPAIRQAQRAADADEEID